MPWNVWLPAFRPWLIIALFGALLIAAGFASLSIKNGHANNVPVGDPWDAWGLEWSIPAPPPEYNFAVLPQMAGRDMFYWRKQMNRAYKQAERYDDIEMPKHSMCGVLVALAPQRAFSVSSGIFGGWRLNCCYFLW